MGIDITYAEAEQACRRDKVMDFLIRGDRCSRQLSKHPEKVEAGIQITQREFADHVRMSQNAALTECFRQNGVS